MLLFAAVVPPAPVREWAAAAVEGAGPGRGQLDAVPAQAMHIPITGFGNLALSETRKLSSLLRAASSEWCAAPLLRFSGATALEWPGDRSVWLKLEGEVDQLTATARSVPDAVRSMGLFVDRRAFRPLLAVGSITEATTAKYLERLVAELDGADGPSWRFEAVSLLTKRWPAGQEHAARLEELERFDLAAA